MIKNIIFDMGGVLLGIDIQACYDEFAALGCPQMNKLIDPYLQSGVFLDLEEGKISPDEFYRKVKETMCPHITDRQIDNALCKMITAPEPYKLDLLGELKAKGYGVYLLSNTNPIMFPRFRDTYFRSRGLTIDAYFDKLFLSYEMKMVKPDPRIFAKVIAGTGINPAETLFIDDGAKNTEAGAKAGLQTYLYTIDEDLRAAMAKYGLI